MSASCQPSLPPVLQLENISDKKRCDLEPRFGAVYKLISGSYYVVPQKLGAGTSRAEICCLYRKTPF